MTEPLPYIELRKGKDRTVDLDGPGVDSWDWDDYTPCGLTCTELGIAKDTDTATEAQITESGKTLRIHFLSTDLTNASAGLYRYELTGTSGTKTINVGGEGTIGVLPAS